MDNEKNGSLFTEKARNKLRSPDDLEEYLRVTSPRLWIVLAACAALLIGVLSWAFFGTADSSVSVEGTVAENGVVCFLSTDAASNVQAGDTANVNGEQMQVESVSSAPVSRKEASAMVGNDYLANTLVTDEWVSVVRIGGGSSSLEKGVPLPVTITTERSAPLGLISKNAK